MVYADLNSFLEMEVSSVLSKTMLLAEIEEGLATEKKSSVTEYNVYELHILYAESRIEIWDTIMQYDETQVPYSSALKDFLEALEKYIPIR